MPKNSLPPGVRLKSFDADALDHAAPVLSYRILMFSAAETKLLGIKDCTMCCHPWNVTYYSFITSLNLCSYLLNMSSC